MYIENLADTIVLLTTAAVLTVATIVIFIAAHRPRKTAALISVLGVPAAMFCWLRFFYRDNSWGWAVVTGLIAAVIAYSVLDILHGTTGKKGPKPPRHPLDI